MIFYLLLLVGQIIQSIFSFLGDDDGQMSGAFQTGGHIGNIVCCTLLLIANGRALYAFHEAGGLHGKGKDLKKPLLDGQDDTDEEDGKSKKKGGKTNAVENDDDDDDDDQATDDDIPTKATKGMTKK